MPDVVLSVVEKREAGGRPVLAFAHYPGLRPFSTGTGPVNLLCGRCGFVLVAGEVHAADRPQMLIRCPACTELNDPARSA